MTLEETAKKLFAVTNIQPTRTYEKRIMEAVIMGKRYCYVDGLYTEWRDALVSAGFNVEYKEIGKNGLGFNDCTISW